MSSFIAIYRMPCNILYIQKNVITFELSMGIQNKISFNMIVQKSPYNLQYIVKLFKLQ